MNFMTPTEILKSILTEQYVSEDGDEYKVELKEGLTDEQIDELAKGLPTGQVPTEIRELLKFASGFEFSGLEEVTFDGVGQFGFEEFLPNSVQLAGDGFGNFWILDVDKNGNWGNVFYVCHDPAVIVKHSDNLAQFIEHVTLPKKLQGSTQFCTRKILDTLNSKMRSIKNNTLSRVEKFVTYNDTTLVKIKNFNINGANLIVGFEKKDLLSREFLNNERENFNSIFYSDLKLLDSLNLHAVFEDNKKLFKELHDYMSYYEFLHSSEISAKKIAKDGIREFIFPVDDGSDLAIYTFEDSKLTHLRKKMIKRYSNIIETYHQSTYSKRMLFIPLNHYLRFI